MASEDEDLFKERRSMDLKHSPSIQRKLIQVRRAHEPSVIKGYPHGV